MAFNFSNIPNYINAFNGISLVDDSIDMYAEAGSMAVNAAKLGAASYRSAGISSIATANYNIGLDQVDTARQLDTLSRNAASVFSTQRAQMAKSGISISSRSFLADTNSTLSNYERQIVQMRNSATQRQQIMLYEGQAAQVQYENAARATEYQGTIKQYESSIGSYQAEQKQSQNYASVFSNLVTDVINM